MVILGCNIAVDKNTRQKWIKAGMYPTSRNLEMIDTLEEFRQQEIKFIDFYDWINLACSVNGYTLLEEIGTIRSDVWNWYAKKSQYYEANKRWDLTSVELMIMLFLHYRQARFVSGGQDYDLINSLLIEIAEHTHNIYTPDEADREWIKQRNKEEIGEWKVISSSKKDDDK